MQKLDKKQIPQVVGLGAVTCGLFGYFGYKIIAPTPAAAHSAPAAPVKPSGAPGSVGTRVAAAPGTPGSGSPLSAAPDAAPDQAAPPTPGMRDPFVPTAGTPLLPAAGAAPKAAPPAIKPVAHAHPISTLPIAITPLSLPAPPRAHPSKRQTRMALLPSTQIGVPGVSPWPSALAHPVLPPAPPVPPAWTVTGILQSGGTQVAVLRNGETRRFVRAGEMVDSQFRIVEVTRDQVVVRHGSVYFSMPLGGLKAVPTKAPTASISPSPALLPPAIASEPQAASPAAALRPQRLALIPIRAACAFAPTPAQPAPTAALPTAEPSAPAPKIPVRLALVPPGDLPARPQPAGEQADEARRSLQLALALYQAGQKAEARSEWQKVLMMNDLAAADEAERLLSQNP